jgi:L-glyceraldehyde 3-phosphate reductase
MIDRTTHGEAEHAARQKPELPAKDQQPHYWPAQDRYERMHYRFTGDSGLQLPAISLGLWHNFGDDVPFSRQRAIIRHAFDLGITQFDLANNYGPPFGAAEENFGRIFDKDLRPYRDELVITTKAGWHMWPGPAGWGGSRKHVLASLEASLRRMGLDHVDIFYSHRIDLDTPMEETMGALASAVHEGKARYVGISSYSAARTRTAAAMLRELGTPLLIHQPNYSMLNRWIEAELLDVLEAVGAGCIPFSPLAQGLLTNKYLAGVPAGSRATQGKTISDEQLGEDNLGRVRALHEIAQRRGQTLAQMAILWVLRDPRVTSALIGASSPEQLEDSVGALEGAPFSEEELAEIDRHAQPGTGVDLWNVSAGL